MRWILLPVLLLSASCRKGIEGEELVLEHSLSFHPKRLELGMSQEALTVLLGPPFERIVSPFGRETWVYPRLRCQATCSTALPGWYLFDQPGAPGYLILYWDEKGFLNGVSFLPEEPSTINIS